MRLIIFFLIIVLYGLPGFAQKSGLVIYSEDESNFALQYAGGNYQGHNSYYIPVEDAGILELYLECKSGRRIRKDLPAAPSGLSLYTLTRENQEEALRYRGRIDALDELPSFVKHRPTLLPEWKVAYIKKPKPTQYREEKDKTSLAIQLEGQKKAADPVQTDLEKQALKPSGTKQNSMSEKAISALLNQEDTEKHAEALDYSKAKEHAESNKPADIKFPLSKHVDAYRALSDDKQRLDYVQARFEETWMTSRQIEFFISGLDNELRKLEMCKWLYPRCKDPEDFERINDQFEFHYTKRKLKRFISNYDKKN